MRIFICEGITEVALVYSLSAKISEFIVKENLNKISRSPFNIGENIWMLNLQGKGNIDEVVKKLAKGLVDKNVEKIGFIMDADENFESMKDSLDGKIRYLKENGIEAEYSYYILPKNDGTLGMAEDLIMSTLYKQNLMKFIEDDIFPVLKRHPDQNIKNNSKTKLMLFGATQDPQCSSANFMLTRAPRLICFENQNFDCLREFIANILQ